MPEGAAARGPPASPSRGPMAPGWAILVILVLSTLRVCGTVPALGQQQQEGGQWVWGAAGPAQAEPPPLSRRKRDDGGSSAGTATLGHGHAATLVPPSKETGSPEPDLLLGSAPPPAAGTNASLHPALAVTTTADPLDETDSPEPDPLLGSVPPPAPSTFTSLLRAFPVPTTADPLDETHFPEPDPLLGSVPPPAPSTFTSLLRAFPVPTTADPLDETHFPEPDPLLGSVPPPAPSTFTSLLRAFPVPTTADPLDETDSPEPDPLLGSVPPPAPGTNASLHEALVVTTTAHPVDETDLPDPLLDSSPLETPGINASLFRAFLVPTTADPLDETDSPDPDLLQDSAPPAALGTEAAPQKSITTIPSWLTSPSEEGTVAGGTDSTSSALGPTATGYKKAGDPPAATRSTAWDMKPWGTAVPVPWDPSRMMGKCLLAILLLALVAATFMVCTGVLGALLWRRRRTAHHRLGPTEMVCISSLLPDGETVANGPKPVPVRRQKLLLDGGSEAEGDNLTLSSFLPEHS